MGYFRDTVKGVSWMTALRGFMRALAVIKIAVLARILSPTQFGNYGIALLVLGFLEVLTETGINVFLIQEKDDTQNYLDSAWVVSIFRGALIAIVILLASPFIVSFFNVQGSANLLYLISGVAFIRGFINPMEITFQKKLQFMKTFMFEGFLYFVDAGLAVALGILTHSESAMIISMMVAAVFEVVLSFLIFKDRPRFRVEKDKVLKVIHSGKWITGAGIFQYIFQNIDNVTVGKVLGTANLGYYQQAYSISTLPVSEIGLIFNKVMFPVYVSISDDSERLKKAFFKTLSIISGLVVLFAIVILVFSRPIILIFLGEKWFSIEPVLKILAIFGALKAILNFSYSLFLSLKLQKYVMFSELFGIVGMGIAIYPMVLKFGTIGAGYSTIIAFVCSLPVVIYGLIKIFK